MTWALPKGLDHTRTIDGQVNIPLGILEHLYSPPQLCAWNCLLKTKEGSPTPGHKLEVSDHTETPGAAAETRLRRIFTPRPVRPCHIPRH